jgi:two-component system CheB/CheR fusion protein
MARTRKTAAKRRPGKRPPARPRRIPRPVPAATFLDVEDVPRSSALPDGMMIVGVGASAGGLEAVTQLLDAAPADAGLAFVLVQHLSPHHQSALPELLAPHTAMPVVQVTDGIHVKPNHVYVIPPNAQMALSGETLQLSPRPEDRSALTPIDGFFASLADAARERAVAIVLSGTASDGAIGIREIKANGGITFAQSPDSARFDGMPRAAIATGMIDLTLSPAQIGAELREIARHPYSRHYERNDFHGVGDDELRKILDLLRPASGVDFRHYKQPTIRRRLLRRMALHRISDINQYIKLLQTDQAELRGLFEDLLIHVTQFFREPDSFTALSEEVFPRLIEGRDPDLPIRVWACGCATGEEAYSLAIELVDFLQRQQANVRVQIFATDVSEGAIEHARAGVYPASIAGYVSADRLRRYFTRSDGNFRVSKQIRDLCVFARQDLTRDPPFSRLDLVMCRNVLIYMDAVLQRKLIGLFHYALTPNGYLVLGQAESVGAQAGLFALTDKKHRIHRKKTLPGAPGVPLNTPGTYPELMAPRKRPSASAAEGETGLQSEISKVLLDRYAPAGVVVDGDWQIVQFRGQTGPFLEPAPGDASLNLLKMVREGLLYGVRNALHAAKKARQTVRRDDLQVRAGRDWQHVSVEVVPLTAAGRQFYLVLFETVERDSAPKGKPKKTAARRPETAAAPSRGVALLQRELEASREYLQSIIQELEAANEELQSANEEILSSNEELQSTNEELDTAKEELQSTNEELNTVNEELHARNDELSRVNSDLVNLVGSVQIAIVIVGHDLRIRRFTPMAEKILNLIPSDLDRSIAHINPNIDCPNLGALITESMDSVTAIERDCRDRQGRWFALRIRPYKTLDNKIEGAVLALFDIDVLKRSEQSMQRAQAFADGLLEGSSAPVALLEKDFRIHKVNLAFARLFGERPSDLTGRPLTAIAGPSWQLQDWREHAGRSLPGQALPPAAVTLSSNAGSRTLTLNARAVPAPDSPDATLLMVSVADGTT